MEELYLSTNKKSSYPVFDVPLQQLLSSKSSIPATESNDSSSPPGMKSPGELEAAMLQTNLLHGEEGLSDLACLGSISKELLLAVGQTLTPVERAHVV